MLPKPRCRLTHATALCRSPVSKVRITKKMALLIIFNRIESLGLPVCVSEQSREESPFSQSLSLVPFVLCTNDMQCHLSSMMNAGGLVSSSFDVPRRLFFFFFLQRDQNEKWLN